MKRFLMLFSLLFLTAGCASISNIKIHSNPSGADVYARPVGGGDLQLLGKTPIFMSSRDMDKKFGAGSGAVYMKIQKEGFKPDDLYITEISRVDISINKDLVPRRDLEMQYWLNHHIGQMFEVRRLVDAKRYKDALIMIRELKEESPMVSKVYEMEGGVLLLQRDYREAVDAYRMAVKFDPENRDAVKMVRYLERTYGFPKVVDYTESPYIPGVRIPASKEESKKLPEKEEATK